MPVGVELNQAFCASKTATPSAAGELVGVIAIYISCPGIYGQYASVMQYKLPDEEIKSNPLSNCVEITRTGNQVRLLRLSHMGMLLMFISVAFGVAMKA